MPDLVARLSRGALGGAFVGLCFAVLLLLVGLFRGLIHGVSTGEIPSVTAQDGSILLLYVGGCLVGGLVAGMAGVFFPSRNATSGRFALAGVVLLFAIMAAERGGVAAIDRFDWGVIITLGAFFGVAAAHGWLKGGEKS